MTRAEADTSPWKVSQAAKPQRSPGLDALRAGATVCVVLLHAGIPYITHPIPGLVWSTADPHPSPLLDAVTWNINVWVMPLFFLLSGFLAAGLMERLGPAEFARHRLARVGGPLLFALVFILPMDLYAWLLSWVNQGWVEPVKLKSLKVSGPLGEGIWGLSHLWYLEYLLAYSLIAAGLSVLLHRNNANQDLVRIPALRLLQKPSEDLFKVTCLLAVALSTLWLQPRILIGFRHSFLPLPENFIFFACWFILGWLRHQGPRAVFAEARLAAGLLAFPVLLGMIHSQVVDESIPAPGLALPLLYIADAWLISTGLFDMSLKWKGALHPVVTRTAEASFWIYLVHHPVVGLAQGNMALLNWPVLLKYLMAFSVGILFPLLTYPLLVRNSWIGVVLNGRRLKVPAPAYSAEQVQDSPVRKAA